ncbi:MAG: phosphotransferase family protein [Gammaproteobacteria bacterium]|nr:phosphotransferase family protein [Gammaproteobacteria bacterium]
MSKPLEPDQALALVPGMEPGSFRIQPMSGGLTNRVYKLTSDKATYILRLNAVHTDAFGLDRVTEVSIVSQASSAGLAPEIVHADKDNGILLLRYVDGRVWTHDDLQIPRNLELLADLLRSVHVLPLSGKRFDALGIANGYLDKLSSRQELHEIGAHCKRIIEDIAPAGHSCCCHNDVVAANIIASPGLLLLDWEYACDNDPLFDLASVIAYHRLDGRAADALLTAYAGGSNVETRQRLSTQVRLYGALHWLWLAVRQVLNPHPTQARQLETLQVTLGRGLSTSCYAVRGA